MKFAYTILYVQDVLLTVQFYEDVLGLKTKFVAPGNEYAEMVCGETTLSFAAHSLIEPQIEGGYQASHPDRKPFGIEIGFVVDDVEAAVQHAISGGATLVTPTQVKPWGQTVAYIKDCNGFLIELCTSMD